MSQRPRLRLELKGALRTSDQGAEVSRQGTELPRVTDFTQQIAKENSGPLAIQECRQAGEMLDAKMVKKTAEKKFYERHEERYDTQVNPDFNTGNYDALTTRLGANLPSYLNRINFETRTLTYKINYRQRSGDVPPGFTSDIQPGEEAKQAPPCSDTAYCQAVKAYQIEKKDNRLRDLGGFRFRTFIAEDVSNKQAVKAIDQLVRPGETKTFKPGEEGYNVVKGTAQGQRTWFALHQHFAGQQVDSITVERKASDVDRISRISFNLSE